MVFLLQFAEVVVVPREDQAGENGPFGDCGAVDSRRGRDGDVRRGVEGVLLDVVAAGGEEVEPGEVWGVLFGVRGERGEGEEDGYVGEDGGGRGFALLGFVVAEFDVRVAGSEVCEDFGRFGEGAGDEDVFFCWSASHCCGLVSWRGGSRCLFGGWR